jgi:serine/threonine protein kinase/tetratricopeptide (TPR) repeat protein
MAAVPPTEADLATQDGEARAAAEPPRAREARGRPLGRGDTVGRYVVLERIGVGGMGEVFAAYDPELDRKIAVKLLLATRGDMHMSAGPARLLREAQAMAKLRHRNVITVHDVGTHEGRVFVAMEFVDGGTLADWMNRGRDDGGTPHPWREVIERFSEAGRGLAAAHAAGLIHRDFKPANVLVDREGHVQVADFGLVRRASGDDPLPEREAPIASEPSPVGDVSLDSDATLIGEDDPPIAVSLPPLAPQSRIVTGSHDSLSLRMTQTGATLGTPAYMAPEQYQGGAVDARADQFSFCVAVWEALYGERPFAGDNLHAVMFAIAHGSIREPSSERDVPGPIRRALARGLANDPAQRWPDMNALLDALRWDPAQRRRRWVAGGLALALVATTALVVSQLPEDPPPAESTPPCLGAEEAFGDALSPARRDAIAQRFGAFEQASARDVGDRLFTRLDAWALDWQTAWTDACEDTHVHAKQSEDLLDRRMVCLDRRRNRFVEFVDALAQADEEQAREMIGSFDELGTVAPCYDSEALLRITPLPDDPAQADAILRAEAAIDDANGLYLAGRYAEARALLEPQREAVGKLAHAPLSAAFEALDGRLAFTLDDRAAGEQALQRGFNRALAAGDDDLSIEIARSLATALNSEDRPKDALRWLDIATALVERNGNDDEMLGILAITRSQSLANDGDYAGAEKTAQEAYERLQRTQPNSAKVGDALYLLGTAAYRGGRMDEAIERVEQARGAWSSAVGPRHPRAQAALTLLGVASRTQGKFAEAQRYFEEALAMEVATLGPDHIEVTDNMMNLAVSFSDQDKLTEAIAMMQRVLEIRRAQPEPSETDLGRTLVNLAQMQRYAGRLAEAQASIEEGEQLMRESLGEDHPDLAVVINIRAEIHLARGELGEADRAIREAIRIAVAKLGPENPGLHELHTNAADIALARDRPREAEKWLAEVAAIEASGPGDRAEREFVQAKTLAELGRLEEALPLARSAKAEFEAIGGKMRNELAAVDEWLAAHE